MENRTEPSNGGKKINSLDASLNHQQSLSSIFCYCYCQFISHLTMSAFICTATMGSLSLGKLLSWTSVDENFGPQFWFGITQSTYQLYKLGAILVLARTRVALILFRFYYYSTYCG